MEFLQLNVADFRRVTGQLSAMHAGALLKMVLWQVTEEAALPLDFDRLCLLAGITGRWEKNAARSVLASHATQRDDGWWIGLGRRSLDVGTEAFEREQRARGGNALRQATFKHYQRACIEALRTAGVSLPRRANMSDIRAAAIGIGLELPPQTGNAGNGVGNALPGNGGNDGVTGGVTRYASSAVSSSLRSESTASEIAAATREMPPFGEAAKAMRVAGLADAHPGHETLRQLVRDGVAIERFSDVAVEARTKGKGAAWALATLKGRIQDEKGGKPPARGAGSARRDHAAELADWAPMLVAHPSHDTPASHGMAPPSLQNGEVMPAVIWPEKNGSNRV